MAAVSKFLSRLLSGPGGFAEVTPATSGGVAHAGEIPALDPTTGLLSISMMPEGVGADTDTSGVCGATSLTAGMFVNFYNNGGTKTVRPADATDNTKPAHGFVIEGFTAGQAVDVYLPGALNSVIPVGALVAADVGKPLYLGASGAATITRPTATGSLDQQLGILDNVGTTAASAFNPQLPVTVA